MNVITVRYPNQGGRNEVPEGNQNMLLESAP